MLFHFVVASHGALRSKATDELKAGLLHMQIFNLGVRVLPQEGLGGLMMMFSLG